MKELQNIAHVVSLGISVASSATHTVNIDTKGFGYAQISVLVGTSGSTAVPIALKVEEGDTTSSYGAIASLVLTNLYTPTTKVTTAGVVSDIGICLEGRKRHLKVSYTPGTTEVVVIHGLLGRAHQLPDTATEKNVGSNFVA